MENIGKVRIDFSLCKNEESGSAYEDDLLNIAKNYSKVEYPGIIEEKSSWSYLYHLSSMRENIVRWLPIKSDDKVLEISSGYGEITGALCEMAGSVYAVDESKKKCLINANRNSDMSNLQIIAGRLEEIESLLPTDFDYVILVGALEEAKNLIDSENAYEELISFALKHAKASGRILIATDNRLGLKYFAGNKEFITQDWFKGIEGYKDGENVKTFSKPSIEKLLKKTGVTKYHFYYPYPDFRLMNSVFSDKRLPKVGELVDNDKNFDGDMMQLFDQSSAFDKLIEDELFDIYSNSFALVIGEEVPCMFARFSNDRINEYAIETTIEDANGKKVVKKKALCAQGDAHILAMKEYEEALSKRYAGSKLRINKCSIEYENERPVALFEYIEGETLSEIMNRFIDKGDNEAFMSMFREYVSRIGYNDSVPVTDKDIVFANIIVDEDDWTLIDYEWTINKSIPTKEIAFRSIYCYLLEHKNANKLNLDLILNELDLSQEAAEDIRYDEGRFQKQITGNRLSMGEINNRIGNKKYEIEKLIRNYSDNESFYNFQVYRAKDGQFTEDNSFFCPQAYINDRLAVVDIDLSADEKMVRIDPLMDSCIVVIKSCSYNGVSFPVADKRLILVNGKRIDDNSFVFSSNDPNMVFVLEKLPKQAMNRLHVEMDIIRIDSEVAAKIAGNIKRIF